MKNIFENLNCDAVGIFFLSDTLEEFFYVHLKFEKDCWQILKFDKTEKFSDLNDFPICVCLDLTEFKSFRTTFPDMPEEDLYNVAANEVILRYGFKTRNDFFSIVRKISNEHEVLFIQKDKIDRILEKFSNMQLRSITIFEPEKKFPIEVPAQINNRALFAANSLAFSEIETINILPPDKRKISSRWNYRNLTLVVWIFATIIFAGLFFYTENSLFDSQKNLQALESELNQLPIENPDEKILLERELNLNEILKNNSDEVSTQYLQRLSNIKIENVFVKSFEHKNEKILLTVIGMNPESLTEFFSKLKNLPGEFKESIVFEKNIGWSLNIEVDLKNAL